MSQPPPPLPGQPPRGEHGAPDAPAGVPAPSPAEPSSSAPGEPGEPGVGGGNGKVVRRRVGALVGAAVAAAVAVAAVGFFMAGGDDEKVGGADAGRPGKELFKIKAPNVPDGESGLWLSGAWVTDEIYARTTTFGVIGMDPASGKRKWKLPLDGLVCMASERISTTGKTAVLMTETESARAKCTKLVVFDVDSGEKEWQKTMRGDDVVPDSKVSVTISQDVVAVRWGRRGTAAYKLSGGPALWKAEPDSECVHESFVGGKELAAVATCDDAATSVESRVQRLDPATGKPTWEFKVPGAPTDVQMVSSDPMVIQGHRGLMVVGEDRKIKSTISLKKHNPGCRADTESCLKAVVDGTHVYLPSLGRKRGHGSPANAVVAFDLDTGEPAWRSDAGRNRTIEPLRMEDGKLIAYKKPTLSLGGEIVAIDPAEKGRKQEQRLRNPDEKEGVEHGFTRTTHEERPLYENGRLYLQWPLLSEDHEHGLGKYVSAAFGPE